MELLNNPYLIITLKIFYATFLGALIGYDRERLGKPAGIKTHSMVCLGSCMIMLIGTLTFGKTMFGDPMRLAAQVVSGIGFLCGGVIIVTAKNEIRGLTTAAGLWFAACMGLCVGSSFAWISVPAILAYYFITHILAKWETNVKKPSSEPEEKDTIES